MAVSRQRSASFAAPWGRGVWITTVGVLALLLVMAIVMPLIVPRDAWWTAWIGPGVLGLILGITAPFCVRGFSIRRGELLIRRLWWDTHVPLDHLTRGWADPEALRRSVRSAGNGGFLAYSGWFWNKRLGRYRAWVTDPARAVVLEIGDRKIVVSPDRPSSFLRALGLDPKDGGPDP